MNELDYHTMSDLKRFFKDFLYDFSCCQRCGVRFRSLNAMHYTTGPLDVPLHRRSHIGEHDFKEYNMFLKHLC